MARRLAPSLVIRLIATLIAATFLAVASLLAGIYFFTVRQPMAEVRGIVAAEAADLRSIYVSGGQQALTNALRSRRAMPSPNRPFDALIDRDGRLLSGNLPSWPRTPSADWVRIEADLYSDGDEDDHEALSRDLRLSDGRRLIVGRDIEVLADRQELMIEAAKWGSIAVILFGLLGGALISWITQRRLNVVGRTAQAVMQGDLTVRVPLQGSGDEFDRLGVTLNAMLDRNMDLMASVARVSDNIAHELRTPLARLLTALEPGAGHGLDEEKANVARAEAERLQTIFDALLRIARLDTGRHQIHRAPVELDQLVRDAVELYGPEAEDKGQSLSAAVAPGRVMGDRDLLFQAIANLIDNAVKFAPPGGEVRADLMTQGPVATLIVSDDGPGVAEEHRPRLTERFFRAPGSESKAGTGLGLTLANAIIEAHGGNLGFEVADSRFRVVVRLPLAQAQQ